MGDVVDTFFWHDPWLGGGLLFVRFRRLYELAIDKSCSVAHMSALVWEEGGPRGGGGDGCGRGRRTC